MNENARPYAMTRNPISTDFNNSMKQSKLTVTQPVNKFPAFYRTRRFIAVFTTARHWSPSRLRSIQSTPSFHKIHCSIILPSTLIPKTSREVNSAYTVHLYPLMTPQFTKHRLKPLMDSSWQASSCLYWYKMQ